MNLMQLSNKTIGLIVFIGVVITFFASAIKGAYQVYFLDLTLEYNIERGTFALTGAVFGLTIGVVSPLVGWVCDRYGAAQTICSGAITTAIVFFGLGLTSSFFAFILLYGILAAYSLAAMTFVPLGLIIDKIFNEKHKGLAFAAITNGTAIGFIVLSPLWVWLNTFLNWYQVCIGIGITFTLIVLPCTIYLNFVLPNINRQNDTSNYDDTLNLKQHVINPTFILLAISFAGCGASMAFIDVHLVPLIQESILETSIKPRIIASTLSLLGITELIGAFLIGYLLRFLNPTLLLASLYFIRLIAMIIIVNSDSSMMFLLFSILFGITYMGTVIITSIMCLNFYGSQIKGRVFGFLFTIHQVSVFITIWGGGLIYDITNTYKWVSLLVATFCLLSVFTSLSLYKKNEATISTHN